MKNLTDEYNGSSGSGGSSLRKPTFNNRKERFSGKCDIRLTKQEDNILNTLANRNNVSRSEIMRKALLDFWKFNSDEE